MNTCNDVIEPAPVPAARSGRARNGKIARLPHTIRETLNERLRDGVPYDSLLSWLNSLPEVREVLQKHFEGAPIVEQNLSRGRCGGYLGWVENQLTANAISIMAAAGKGIDPAEREALTGQIATALSARLV